MESKRRCPACGSLLISVPHARKNGWCPVCEKTLKYIKEQRGSTKHNPKRRTMAKRLPPRNKKGQFRKRRKKK